ncbi:MAG: DNA repair protein RecO [Myxococcales bacterium]
MSETRQRGFAVTALVLRKIEYADSDLVVLALTETLGPISVIARSARASKRRFSGGIEPFHSLRLDLEQPRKGELLRLRDTQIEIPRYRLVQSYPALDIAGRALAWVRKTTVAHSAEPGIYRASTRLLDHLDREPPTSISAGEVRLCQFGLVLLNELGWALELGRCVRCSRPCPPDAPATLDPRQGGLVCRRCGGARHRLTADLRQRMLAMGRDEAVALEPGQTSEVISLIEAALLAHSGVETL